MKLVQDGVTIFEVDLTTGDITTGGTNLSQPGGPHTHQIADVEGLQAALDAKASYLTGEVKLWPLANAPAGFLLCDGAAVSRATYAALYTALGDTYGAGNGTTTFNVPNLKGRVPVGLDSGQTEFDALAETGGAKTHTLTSAEMPSHTHTQDAHTHTQNSHNHTQDAHNHVITSQTATTGSATSYEHGALDTSSTEAEVTEVTASTTATNQAATAMGNPTSRMNLTKRSKISPWYLRSF